MRHDGTFALPRRVRDSPACEPAHSAVCSLAVHLLRRVQSSPRPSAVAPLSPYAGHVTELFDDVIEPAAVGYQGADDGDSRKGDALLRERTQTGDAVVRARVVTVTSGPESQGDGWRIGLRTLETIAGKRPPEGDFTFVVEGKAPRVRHRAHARGEAHRRHVRRLRPHSSATSRPQRRRRRRRAPPSSTFTSPRTTRTSSGPCARRAFSARCAEPPGRTRRPPAGRAAGAVHVQAAPRTAAAWRHASRSVLAKRQRHAPAERDEPWGNAWRSRSRAPEKSS